MFHDGHDFYSTYALCVHLQHRALSHVTVVCCVCRLTAIVDPSTLNNRQKLILPWQHTIHR